jgi:3-oxoadipate enol-lactonase
MRFVKANGLVIHYLDQGRRDGAPIVFINALGCDLRIWTEIAEILAPDFRIVTYDKRGHGLSESGPDKCEMADYARDLIGLLDSVGVGRATVVGLSIGGVIAQEFCRLRPERVAALVLCDTAAKIGTDESWDQRIAEVERGGVERVADSVLERWFTAEFRASRATEFTGIRAMLTRTPRQGYLAACGALKRATSNHMRDGSRRPPCAWSAMRTARRPSLWLRKRGAHRRLAL